MTVPTRHAFSNEYRYGFQGQEKDDEIKEGDGNSLNYKFRMHDPRVGRFFAVDPLFRKYPHNSTYAFSENSTIAYIELEGLEKDFYYDAMDNATEAAETKTFGTKKVLDGDYVIDGSIVKEIPDSRISVSYGESTLFNFRGDDKSSGTLKHFGIVIDVVNSNAVHNAIKVPVKDNLSIGKVHNLDGDASNFAGFFIGISGTVDGVGVNHSGWYGDSSSSTTATISLTDLFIDLGTEMHNINVSINVDFFIDPKNTKSGLKQYNDAVDKFNTDLDTFLNQKLYDIDSEMKKIIKKGMNKIESTIKSKQILDSKPSKELIDSPIPTDKSKNSILKSETTRG